MAAMMAAPTDAHSAGMMECKSARRLVRLMAATRVYWMVVSSASSSAAVWDRRTAAYWAQCSDTSMVRRTAASMVLLWGRYSAPPMVETLDAEMDDLMVPLRAALMDIAKAA